MQLSLLCSLALLSWITWTACWMMWVNNCHPIMMYCLQHLLNLRKVSYLQQWLLHQWHYLAILLDMEAPPEPRDLSCVEQMEFSSALSVPIGQSSAPCVAGQNTSTSHSTGWNNGMEHSLRNHPCSWLLTYLNNGDQSPCNILAFIKSLSPCLTRIKECCVKLATTMAHAWWQNDSGKVELGYERRLLWDVIVEAAEFFTGVLNSGILLPLLINSHPSPTAEHAALHAMCTEGLKDINQELLCLSKLILHSQEQMSSLEAVT
ncbi:hypothetical protein F5J12DRAFT_785300 [Pisolithus orientalis]|uniref:uncharacterized protein n=1 Tax=Pisolithus orientalis TaxID=936130 RepID=UPI0022247DFC|nr:uncharacterized protein F5J12DRAFT_785300 [Pisolithus orientalis]KAI5996882.1 hypothetical protein F5J12DRAFT_785300 [Pisolithus orientalis]